MILNRKFIDKTKKHFWIQCERKTPTNDFLKMERNSGVLALFQPKKNSENILYSTERSTLSRSVYYDIFICEALQRAGRLKRGIGWRKMFRN